MLNDVYRLRREVGGKSGMKGRVWMLTGYGKGCHKPKGGIREERMMNLYRTTCFLGI
jgi:hypothetical protein